NRPIIIGGTVLDITARLLPSPFSALGTSTPGHVRQTSGGVARNVAEACHRLGGEPVLCSVVGDDVAGRALLGRLRASGMSVEAVGTVGSPTAIYSCILDAQGGLLAGVADMRALDGLTADRIGAWL
ncbi:Ribokinase-like protein, partial [Hyaloraphidium curvatum]